MKQLYSHHRKPGRDASSPFRVEKVVWQCARFSTGNSGSVPARAVGKVGGCPLRSLTLPARQESLPARQESLPARQEALPARQEALPARQAITHCQARLAGNVRCHFGSPRRLCADARTGLEVEARG